MITQYFLLSVTVTYIYWFIHVEPVLPFWSETNLNITPFNKLLDLVFLIFIKDFRSKAMRNISL